MRIKELYNCVIIVALVFVFYSCAPNQVSKETPMAQVQQLENIDFASDLLSLSGNIQPFNYEVRIDTLDENKFLINLSLYTDFPSALPKFEFAIKYPRKLVNYLWSSSSWTTSSYISIPNYSRLQSDNNILTVLTTDSKNRITLASNDDFEGRYSQIDVKQIADSLAFSFNFFNSSVPDAEVLEFKVKILVDMQDRNFSHSVRESSQWRLDGMKRKRVTKIDPSLLPVYSVWYPMDRNVPLENVTHYFDSIASMGFRSVLFDDAWQNVVRFDVDKNGNWDPAETKIVKEFIAKSKEKKMKVALWYSKPFIGAHKYVFDRFDGRYLQYITASQPLLDIRYPEVRDYLTNMYSNIVNEWGIDGIWFNFLNGYYPDEKIIVTPDNGRDFVSVRKALDSLRMSLETSLVGVKENISINQSYPTVGPMHTSNSRTINGFLGTSILPDVREKVVNNRLMYGEFSPFMEVMGIHPKDPAVDVARKFQAILYGVPYVSYFSYTLTEDIRQTLSFWIRYWKTNYQFLQESTFEVYSPILKYPVVKAGNETKQIVTVYDRVSVDLGGFDFETADVINSSSIASVSINGSTASKVDYIVHNYKGVYISRGVLKFKKDNAIIDVPVGGFVRLIVKE